MRLLLPLTLFSLIFSSHSQQSQWVFQNGTHVIKNQTWHQPGYNNPGGYYPAYNAPVYNNSYQVISGFHPPPARPNVTYIWAPQAAPAGYNPGYQYQRINKTHAWAPVEVPQDVKGIKRKSGNHLYVGTVGPMDIRLYKGYVQKDSKWYKGREKTIEYPGSIPVDPWLKNRVITAIRCTDQDNNGRGGNCTVKKGGVGYQNVTLECTSFAGRGFNFAVEIYGH